MLADAVSFYLDFSLTLLCPSFRMAQGDENERTGKRL